MRADASFAALGRRIQSERARAKRALRDGTIRAHEAARERSLANMPLVDFFMLIPGVGKVKAERLFQDLECEPWHRVRDLTPSDLIALREEERFIG